MSQKRFNLLYNPGTFPEIDVDVARGRRSSVRKFMAMLSAVAVVVAGLTVGLAGPAQAAAIETNSTNMSPSSNSFTITLSPFEASGDLFATPIDKANFTITGAGNNSDALKSGTWTLDGSETVITISGVSGLTGATVVSIADAARKGGGAWNAGSRAVLGQAKVDVTSAAFTMTATHNAASITLTGGTFKTSILRSDFTFAGTNAVALTAGTFTRTSDTVVTITGLSNLSGVNNTALVKAATMTNGASSVTGASLIAPITSAAFTMNAANTQASITVLNGTFKTGAIVASDFTFAGTDAAALAAGSFTRTSDTVVTITGLSNLFGGDNVITVLAATLATASSGGGTSTVAGAGATIAAVASAPFTLVAGDNQTTVTLTGAGVFADTLSSANFSFAGSDAAVLAAGTFTRTGATTVVIRYAGGRTGTNNLVTVLPSGQAGQSNVPTVTSTKVDVTSAAFSMIAGATTATVTLTGGTFKAGAIVASDFTFAGTNAVALAAGTFTRTSETVVTITGLSNLSGVNNTALVKAATMTNGALSVTGASGAAPEPAPVPAPAPAVVPGPVAVPVPVTAPAPAPVPAPAPNDPIQAVVNEVLGATPTQVQRLTAAQLAALPPAAFAVMSPAQVKALNPAQVVGLSGAQIQAIPASALRAMKPVTLRKFSVMQIRALLPVQASSLRVKQTRALGPVKRKIVASQAARV